MEMIDRYVYAVTKRLPQKQREDIEKELRSLIDDMIMERCGINPPRDKDIEIILTELGNPSKLAAKYRDDNNYLIGPEHFDSYIFILRIVMAAVAFGIAVGKIVEFFVDPPALVIQAIGEFFAAIISGAFQGFAWVTIIFALSERYAYHKISGLNLNKWSVSDLPEIPQKEQRIKPSEAIVGIVFSVLFIIIFNFSSQLIGVYNFVGGKLVSITPIFSEQDLKNFLPLIIVIFCLSILKECLKLIIGKWNLTLGIATAAINIISLIFCIVLFTSPTIWNSNFVNELNALTIVPQDLDISLDVLWQNVTNGFILLIAFGLILDSVVSIIKGIKYSIK